MLLLLLLLLLLFDWRESVAALTIRSALEDDVPDE
jgi:hypothetical protein